MCVYIYVWEGGVCVGGGDECGVGGRGWTNSVLISVNFIVNAVQSEMQPESSGRLHMVLSLCAPLSQALCAPLCQALLALCSRAPSLSLHLHASHHSRFFVICA